MSITPSTPSHVMLHQLRPTRDAGREYATRLGKPFIYGPTSHAERTRVLHACKHSSHVNTVFLSKGG